MANEILNNVGQLSTTLNILREASRRNAALAILADSPLPDDLKAEIFLSYKTLKRKQMIIMPLVFVGWFVCIILVLFAIDSALNGGLYEFVNKNIFTMLLGGAFMVLPIWFIFKAIFKGDTPWDTYYDWYKNQKDSRLETSSLLHRFGIEEETAVESNERIANEMKRAGKTKEQIEAVMKARSDYQLKAGLRPETEDEENARIRKQMKDSGYTDEQIEKAFGK